MKNILLLVHDDPGQEGRLQAALDLTRALGGHLTCLHVTDIPLVFGDPYLGPAAESAFNMEERARGKAIRQRLEARLAVEDVAWDWLEITGSIAGTLQDAAKLADLVVVSRALDTPSMHDMGDVAARVMIGSGKAIVAVPETAARFEAAGRALIAWDGSDEAMRAVQTAVPLLKLAQKVVILEVFRNGAMPAPAAPAEELAAYLSRHGIVPVVTRRSDRGSPVGDAIIAEARAEGVDYVVMGGFGHSRLGEALFGGVSQEMLTESPIPTFMVH